MDKRLCKVKKKGIGYLLVWEHFQKRLNKTPLGSSVDLFAAQTSEISRIYGIVEFPDGTVNRVDPTNIEFIDKEHYELVKIELEDMRKTCLDMWGKYGKLYQRSLEQEFCKHHIKEIDKLIDGTLKEGTPEYEMALEEREEYQRKIDEVEEEINDQN